MPEQIQMRYAIGTRDDSWTPGQVLTVGVDVDEKLAAALCAGDDPNAFRLEDAPAAPPAGSVETTTATPDVETR